VFDQTYLFEEVFVKYFTLFFKLMFVGLDFYLYSFFQPLISQLNKFAHIKALKSWINQRGVASLILWNSVRRIGLFRCLGSFWKTPWSLLFRRYNKNNEGLL